VTGSPPPPAPAQADAAGLPDGYRLFEYQIERQLGGGGFGITYLARDVNLDLPVAVKEYFPSDSVTRLPNQGVQVRGADPDVHKTYQWGLERFLDEARALATFRHRNIVRVLRYFRENGTAYIVMEYESGDPLKRWVPHNAPLTQRALLSIVYPLLDGLEAVHKTGFLHRDIKPDNIYVRADGTPVLLDFGAARRVSANRDMTNIVSPGFAPFEQYHSQGHQGPWTDIYSLGAVMYWMTTGKKPVEAASRVKTDGMLPAASLADAAVFGAPLLQAIDWAMRPDEAARPQDVAQFRAAIVGSERPEDNHTRSSLGAAGYAGTGGRTGGSTGSPPSGASGASGASSAQSRKNMLCTIMFLDLVGYSTRSVDDQVALKKIFNELIGKALMGVDESSRIAIDTGDGAAICFTGDPEEALQSAMLMRDLLGQRYGRVLSVRIGLHMGPVRVISDINARVNVVGDGINVAQRVMDFAQGNQVLVSRAYYDVISRITDDTAGLFDYLGQYADKHGRAHEVYLVTAGSHGTTRREGGPSTGYTQTQPIRPALPPIDPGEVAEVEAELARHIGPLARVLVRKARPLAHSIAELREALGPSIQDPRAREAFVAGVPAFGHSTGHSGRSQPLSQPRSVPRSQPLSQPFSQPFSQPQPPTQPPSRPSGQPRNPSYTQPLTQPMTQPRPRQEPPRLEPSRLEPSRFEPSMPMPSQPVNSQRAALHPEDLAAVEVALSRHIGPMAKMIVRKEAARAASLPALLQAVAASIDQSPQREQFLAGLQKSLPRR